MRIVIGEDSALVREGMAKLLADAGHDIVAKVGDAAAVVAAVERSDPDLLITDIRMPPTMTDDGARAARALRALRPTLPIVLLSQHVETTQSLELVATGSFGYLLKDRVLDVEDFLDALTRVPGGGSALDPEVVASLVAPTRGTDPLASLPNASSKSCPCWPRVDRTPRSPDSCGRRGARSRPLSGTCSPS